MKNFDEFNGLKKLLGALRAAPQRDEKVAQAARQRFLQQVDAYSARPRRVVAVAAAAGPFAFLKRPNFATVALTTLLVFVFLATAGVGVVAASESTLPGDAFYAVKVFGEDFRLALTAEGSADFALLGGYVERRYDEIDALLENGYDVPESTAVRLQEHLQAMLTIAAGMDDADMAEALSDIQAVIPPQYQGTNGDQDRLQDQYQTKTMVQIRKMSRDSWDATVLGLEEPNQFRYMYTWEYAGEGPGEGVGAGTGTPSGEMYGPGPEKQATGTPEDTGFGPGPDAGTGEAQDNGEGYGPGPNETEQPAESYGPGGSYGTGTPVGDEDAEYGPGPNETEQPSSSYGPGPSEEAAPEETPVKKQIKDGNGKP